MSNLAPFVASALRDKVVTDLREDNSKQAKAIADIKSSICGISSVLVSGPGGSPVYRKWKLNFDSTELGWDAYHDTKCGDADEMRFTPVEDLLRAEIRLGGDMFHVRDLKASLRFGDLILLHDSNIRVTVYVMDKAGFRVELPFELDPGADNSIQDLVEKLKQFDNHRGATKLSINRIYAKPKYIADCLTSNLAALAADV